MLNYTGWEKSYEDMLAEAEFIIESQRKEHEKDLAGMNAEFERSRL